MIKRFALLLAALTVLATATAGGCEDSKGHCTPGDTRGSKGHTDVCNDHGKWAPYVKPTVRPKS